MTPNEMCDYVPNSRIYLLFFILDFLVLFDM